MNSRSRLAVPIALVIALAACTGPNGSGTTGAAATSAPTSARVVSTRVLSPRLRDLVISSPAVGRDVTVRILVPVDFARSNHSLPVLYLLHGCCDTYDSWTRSTDIVRLSARTEMLVVMPEGGAVGFYSNWLRGPRWEDFHLVELPRILQQNYRASTDAAIAGISMGGLGALGYAARHPGTFRAAASFSGVVDTRLSSADSRNYRALVSSQGEDPADLWGDPGPDAGTWQEHNPFDLAAKLRGTKLFISCGSGRPGPGDDTGQAAATEKNLRAENGALITRLHALQVAVTTHLYSPGVHDWLYWKRELHRAWPLLVGALGV